MRPELGILLVVTSVLAWPPALHAETHPDPFCRLMLREESIELQDTELEVELARSAFASFEEVFRLVESLWQGDAIDRMAYLRAKYDRDAAKLDLERADLILLRQTALIGQLQRACEGPPDDKRTDEIDRVHLEYRRADCDQIAKAIEVAKTSLTFNRQWLASVLDLREQVSTRQDVILAELNVLQEEQRRDDALRRTEACRAELAELEGASTDTDKP